MLETPLLAGSIPTESRIIYEWFAGWRWEHFRAGKLVAESLQCFETREECLADARRAVGGRRGRLIRVPAAAISTKTELAQLAA